MFQYIGSSFVALLLLCSSITIVVMVYLCLLCFPLADVESNGDIEALEKPNKTKGLSAIQLEKLPKVTGKDLVMGAECAVCLDDIESHEAARMIPGCNHGFHLQCADSWLARNSVCPVCRGKISHELLEEDVTEANQC